MKYIFTIALLFLFAGMVNSNTLINDVSIEKADVVVASETSDTITYVVEASPVMEIVVDVGKSDISNSFTQSFIEHVFYSSKITNFIGNYRRESIDFNYNYLAENPNKTSYRRARDGLIRRDYVVLS